MIEAMVRKIMTEAVNRFAIKEDVAPSEISMVIHTKNEGCFPEYYYMVKNAPKKDENGQVISLDFTGDILNKKMDLLNKEGKAAYFLSEKFKFFEKLYENDGLVATNIYIILKPVDEVASDFHILLYNNSKMIKQIQLEELFQIG